MHLVFVLLMKKLKRFALLSKKTRHIKTQKFGIEKGATLWRAHGGIRQSQDGV